jgi:hypothetical protein
VFVVRGRIEEMEHTHGDSERRGCRLEWGGAKPIKLQRG